MCSFFKCNNLLIKVFKELNGVNMYNKKTKSKKKLLTISNVLHLNV